VNGTKLLLDTNIVLCLLSGDRTIANLIDGKQIYISIITEFELLGYQSISEEDQKQIKAFLGECMIINIGGQIKEMTIELRKAYNLKLPDSIIAATSQHLDIPLITSDQGFNKIEEVNVLLYTSEEE